MTSKQLSDKIAEAIMDSEVTDKILVVLLGEALDSIFLNIESLLDDVVEKGLYEEFKIDFKHDLKTAKAIVRVIDYCSWDFSTVAWHEKVKEYKKKYKALVIEGCDV
jgi:hypothetical protein